MAKYNQNMSAILDAAKKMKARGWEDPNKGKFWRASLDKNGNGSAIIRFLPSANSDGTPFVKIYAHGFKGPSGRWYIENCPTTIGHECPVCEANGVLWNSGIEKDKVIVRERKRKLSFVSNVLVISDPANPENQGKVFMFKYGPRIFDKIVSAMQPEFEDEVAINPFDLENGADFRLKIRRVDGQANFDKSSFESETSSVADPDTVMEMCHDIDALVAPDQFKAYDELQKKFYTVTGAAGGVAKHDEDDEPRKVTERAKPNKGRPEPVAASTVDEDDEDLAYFKRLAEDDVPF